MDHGWQFIDFDDKYAIAASYISEKDSIVSAVVRERRPCLNWQKIRVDTGSQREDSIKTAREEYEDCAANRRDMRYDLVEDGSKYTQRELFDQNGISELIDKVNMRAFQDNGKTYENI